MYAPIHHDDSWHLDKKVPLAMIVTLLVYGVSGLWFIADIKRDVEILKAQRSEQRDRDDRQERDLVSYAGSLERKLERIEIKLDRVIEGKMNGGGKQ